MESQSITETFVDASSGIDVISRVTALGFKGDFKSNRISIKDNY